MDDEYRSHVVVSADELARLEQWRGNPQYPALFSQREILKIGIELGILRASHYLEDVAIKEPDHLVTAEEIRSALLGMVS